ncbi:unnamed protein product [Rotaria sordida]|uniref:Uncharacterized protein n=1 Tax=Rotaria sordida TaxID=392033 RepID=A0A819T7B2_9BILA|nr:unnamed protein product [Rotaria sordida]CAF4070409.1 unnamed protein product [Rotaria sordida]
MGCGGSKQIQKAPKYESQSPAPLNSDDENEYGLKSANASENSHEERPKMNGVHSNKNQAPASSNSDDETEYDPEPADAFEDLQEERPKMNEVHSNKSQAPTRHSSRISIESRKKTSAASRESTLTHHTSSPLQNQSPSIPDTTVGTGQMNASLQNPKYHNSLNPNNSDSDDNDLKPKGNHNVVGENPTTTGKFHRSSANPRKSLTLSRQSDIDKNRKTPTTPIQNTSHPYFCPHCHQSMPTTTSKKLETPQPPWIMEAPPTTKKHIDMDKYDEETMQQNITSKYRRLPGSYDYFPNIVIDEREGDDDKANDYIKQTTITRHGSSISPTHTPYPNYDLLRRHEHRLNKPFTSKSFVD